jgi:hypothetical protein
MAYSTFQLKRLERKRLGICKCGNKLPDDKPRTSQCLDCRTKTNKKHFNKVKKNKDKGLCSCGRPPESNYVRCSRCRNTKNVDYKKVYVDKGMCAVCGKNPILNGLVNSPLGLRKCEKCYLKTCSKRNLESSAHWQELKQKLINQDYKCVYTGTLIELGVNDSLDHIKPASKFPELAKDVNNVEWVARGINSTKWNRTSDEFINLVVKIAYNNKQTNHLLV